MSRLDLEALAHVALLDVASGEQVVLGDLWRTRETPLVLVWLRHYG